jgi:micrococcal nuclease
LSNIVRFERPNPWRKAVDLRPVSRRRWRWNFPQRLVMWRPLIMLVGCAGALWAFVEYRSALPQPQPLPFAKEVQHIDVRFDYCGNGSSFNCVIDGDTIRYGGFKIRLADIDAPELFSPKCASELDRARQATQRLKALLNQGPVQILTTGSRDRDSYGRKLRVIERNGRSIGDILVAEGLARPWNGPRRSWCG